jgi:hypothetical protein
LLGIVVALTTASAALNCFVDGIAFHVGTKGAINHCMQARVIHYTTATFFLQRR